MSESGASELAVQRALVTSLQRSLMVTAWLLTQRRTDAEDLVQDVLVKVLLNWKKVRSAETPEAYARQMLVNAFLSGRRRAQARELVTSSPPDTASVDEHGRTDDWGVLRHALRRLPPRQRAAVVLRHYGDLSEAQVAEALGCSVGTVKSLTSRGLQALRADLEQLEEVRP